MQDLKDKYERAIIKLGNSKAITFPQEWTNKANLKDKSIVILYPVDDKTIIVRAEDVEEKKTIFKIDTDIWPIKLIKQALISAFKLNCDEILLKYNDKNQDALNQILIDLGSELFGIDFKNLTESKTFSVNFLLDTSKKPFSEVLMDLSNVFTTIIKNVIEGTKKTNNLLLAEIDKKYSLGTRILITGLSDFPISKGYNNLPIIRYLGDRVTLLYIRDFINEALNLQLITNKIIKKYSEILLMITNLLIEIIKNYNNMNLDSISVFQENLKTIQKMHNNIKDDINLKESNIEEQQVKNIIKYYLNSFNTFFDIGITRMIEFEIGIS